MKIAVISDSHNNSAHLAKTAEWLKKENINIIIHCGDVQSPEELKEFSDNFSGKIYLSLGNSDDSDFSDLAEKSQKIIIFKEVGELEIDGKKIAFCHMPETAKETASSGKYNIVFYGHTHKPWEEMINNCKLANPGNLAGIFYKATFAVYDAETDVLELKILERLNQNR